MSNPEFYIEEAKKLENSKSIFEYLMKDITSSRYEKIAELYSKAGNIYKISNKEQAIKCFKKVLHYNRQLSESSFNYNYDTRNILLNIAELYTKIDYLKSVEYYEQIINYYTEKGEIYNIVKYYEIIGDLYWDNNLIGETKQIYYKTLNLINSNSPDKYYSTKKRLCERICEILICSNDSNSTNVLEVSKIYFDLADDSLRTKLSIYYAKKYILLGLLADCAGDDFVKGKNDLKKYSELDHTFLSSNEGIFIEKIFKAIDSNDSDELSFLCADLDKIIPLDKIQVNLLSRIKKLIDNDFSNCSNDNTNKVDEIFDDDGELDLS